MSAIALDPLIAEAKQRTRRRRLLALASIIVVAAAAVGTTRELRSSPNVRGICASVPSGWKERMVTRVWPGHPTVWLTNFRFGRMNDLLPQSDLYLPAHSVTVAVTNEGRRYDPSVKEGTLYVTRADFDGLEGLTQPSGFATARSHGAVLAAYIELGALTPATIAAVNEALAGVRTCSA